MSAFVTTRIVRFADCDPAGIVFYPRYFEMFNGAVEDWFRQALDYSWADMHLRDRRGVPMVDIHTRFHKPSRLSDTIHLHLFVRRIGRSAIDATIEVRGEAGDLRVETDFTVVFADFDRMASTRIPEPLAEKMRAFVTEAAA